MYLILMMICIQQNQPLLFCQVKHLSCFFCSISQKLFIQHMFTSQKGLHRPFKMKHIRQLQTFPFSFHTITQKITTPTHRIINNINISVINQFVITSIRFLNPMLLRKRLRSVFITRSHGINYNLRMCTGWSD